MGIVDLLICCLLRLSLFLRQGFGPQWRRPENLLICRIKHFSSWRSLAALRETCRFLTPLAVFGKMGWCFKREKGVLLYPSSTQIAEMKPFKGGRGYMGAVWVFFDLKKKDKELGIGILELGRKK